MELNIPIQRYIFHELPPNQKTAQWCTEERKSPVILTESSKRCQSRVNMEGLPSHLPMTDGPSARWRQTELIEGAHLCAGATELLTGCDGVRLLS